MASALVGIPLALALVLYAPLALYAGVILVLALVGQAELYAMFAGAGVAPARGLGFLLGGVVVGAFAAGERVGPEAVAAALALAVMAALTSGVWRARTSRCDWTGPALTLLGVCYCAWLLGHAVWLRALPAGGPLTVLLLGVTWCGESAAFAVGGRWGRRRLAARVSPGKTVEGAIAQLLVSVAVALVGTAAGIVSLPHALGIGVLLGVAGQVGDLAESLLKRSAGAKDAGTIVPGHGGLLDRLDSLLFNLPALYYYVKFVGG